MVPPTEIRTADIRTSLLRFNQADHESAIEMRCHRFYQSTQLREILFLQVRNLLFRFRTYIVLK